MKNSISVAAFIGFTFLSYVSAVHTDSEFVTVWHTRTGDPPVHTIMPGGLSSESAQGKTLSPATIPASSVTPASVTPSPVLGNGVMTIEITNHWKEPLSVSYMDNADSPGPLGSPTGAPLGTKTTVVYPTGWAGRIYVGKTTNSANTKIEGSTTGWNDIDVSYVDGYSVPVTCSAHGVPVSGCNIDLWDHSGKCENLVGDKDVCLNPMQDVADGPSVPWFLPCQGAAYTFPNDNIANNGDTGNATITCCIGTEKDGCKAPDRQGKCRNVASKAKRSVPLSHEQPLAFRETVKDNESDSPYLKPHAAAHAHSHLKRHLNKARSHRHGVIRDLKDVI